MRKKLPIAVIVVMLVVGIAYFSIARVMSGNDDYYGIYYGKDAPDFTLTDQYGNPVTLSQFRGKDVLLSFGYTSCPDICPTTLTRLNGVMKALDDAPRKVQVLFVTIDPERDTEKRLKGFIPYFNDHFLGLTGNQDEIKNVADSYSVFYERAESGDTGAGYFMNHTQTVYLIDQKGKLTLVYPYDDLEPEKIASDINRTYANNG